MVKVSYMRRNPDHYNKFKKLRCEVCGNSATSFNPLDVDHVKTIGSGGKDESCNLMTLCRSHHIEKGRIGLSGMANKYPIYKQWLLSNGWEIEELRGKWVRY